MVESRKIPALGYFQRGLVRIHFITSHLVMALMFAPVMTLCRRKPLCRQSSLAA
jgi:hypothetical protein